MSQDLGPSSLLIKSRWSFFHSPGTCRCERNSLHRGLQKVQSQGRENMYQYISALLLRLQFALILNYQLVNTIGTVTTLQNLNFSGRKVIGWPRFVTQEHFPEFHSTLFGYAKIIILPSSFSNSSLKQILYLNYSTLTSD